MSSNGIPQNPTASNIVSLLPKFTDDDSDLRYMSVNDLYIILTIASNTLFTSDQSTCARVIDALLKLLDDRNGDVQSQAIKCLGPLAAKLPTQLLFPLIEKLSMLKPENSLDSSIPSTSLRALVSSFPRPIPGVAPSKPTQDAYAAISKVLIPRLVGYIVVPHGIKGLPDPPPGMLAIDPRLGADTDALDVLIEVIRCFGSMLLDLEKLAFQKKILEILKDDRTGNVTKKKAVTATSLLVIHMTDSQLSTFIKNMKDAFQRGRLQRRILITVLGSLARFIPQRLGQHLEALTPFIFKALSKAEFDEGLMEINEDGSLDPTKEEVKEAALITLECFLSSCSSEMRVYTNDVIDSSLRYVKYSPSLTTGEDDEVVDRTQSSEDDEGDIDDAENSDMEDEDFEEEGGMSDDDDASWKIRRCAAKVLYTLIMTRASGDLLETGILYEKVAPVLIKCFQEREENVRLEVLSAMTALIKKTGEGASKLSIVVDDEGYASGSSTSKTRKRRRSGSDASMFDAPATSTSKELTSPAQSPSPISNAQADLARLRPSIVQAAAKLLRSNSLPTKQATTTLLHDVVVIQNGSLNEQLGQIIDPILDYIKTPGTSGATSATTGTSGAFPATSVSLRIEALRLVGAICETHVAKAISPYVGKIIPSLIKAANDKYFKISSEAVHVLERLIEVLTPPRSAGMEDKFKAYLSSIFDAIVDRVSANDTDLEVRQQAIHALGTFLARSSRTSKIEILPVTKRSKALDILHDRLKSEITRVESVQAIDTLAISLADKDELKETWVRNVALELAGQLRKSDRTLRDTSLKALKHLVAKTTVINKLNEETVRALVQMLLPLLDPRSLSLLGLTLEVITDLVQRSSKVVVTEDFNNALCRIVVVPLSDNVLDALLTLVATVGATGAGKPLMQNLLKDVGVTGDPAIVGAAIGTLLVSGESTVGIHINDFINELHTAPDDGRKCLALSVLGEAGLRLGSSSPLQPNVFADHFRSKSTLVPRAAAVGLGRAGAGNPSTYLPMILSAMNKRGNTQYLLLHSIKEVLQYASKKGTDISNYTEEIWTKLLSVSEMEDNKVLAAECIGRLISIEPRKYFPMLQTYLKDPKPLVRGMVMQAVRYAFTDQNEEFDRILKPLLVGVLTTMLNDTSLENRRLALTTLNSATLNKSAIIVHHLSQLLPLVIRESIPNPSLMREVQMGPFKHKVDDGLEIRKSAYETLNTLMNSAFSRMNSIDLYDRVTAGLDDEHEIKILCNLMITKLMGLAREETARRLDSIAERFQAILAFKPKENAVKQEIEKAQEASKGVLRVTIRLHHAFAGASNGAVGGQIQCLIWRGYWEWVGKEMKSQLQSMEMEIKSEAT